MISEDLQAPEDELETEVIESTDEHQVKSRSRRQAAQPEQDSVDFRVGNIHISDLARRLGKKDKIKEIRKAYLKLKKYSKPTKEDVGILTTSTDEDFWWNAYRTAECYSSSVDKYECYPYLGFPFKRAVKIVMKDGQPYIDVSSDSEMYGICVDVNEETQTATVLPMGYGYRGYLVCNYNTTVKKNDLLDFSNTGEVVKSVAPNLPTKIHMYALSDSIKLDYRNKTEQASADFKPDDDYALAIVHVCMYGNRSTSKTT